MAPAPTSSAADLGEEVQWVRAAQGGDRQAFERLYRKHARRIAGLVHRAWGRDGEMEELVQDTFVAAYQGLPKLREPERFGGWLSGIAVNLVRQRIARQTRWRSVRSRLAPPVAVEPSSGDAAKALNALPADLRLPFVLHRLEGFGIRETAEMCGVSEATTKRRCAAATERLARRLR